MNSVFHIKPFRENAPDLPCDPDDVIALGTAIAALQPTPETNLSLMQPRIKDEMVLRREKPYWIVTGVMAALSLAVFLLSAVRVFNRQQEELKIEERYQKDLSIKIGEIENTKKRIARYHKKSAQVQQLLEAGPRLRELIRLIANSIHPDDWVSMVCDAETYFTAPDPTTPSVKPRPTMRDLRRPAPPKKKTVPEAPKSSEFTRFIIEGYTPNRSLVTVQDLITNLQKAELVEQVDLLADNLLLGTRWEGTKPMTNLTHFVIELKARKP